MWLRKTSSNEQAGIQQRHKATTTNVIKKTNVSKGQASIQRGHKATTTNVIKKNVSSDQAGVQQEHKATTTNVIKNKIIQWARWHPTITQGHNNQRD